MSNSKPLEACTVISWTASCPTWAWFSPASKLAWETNPANAERFSTAVPSEFSVSIASSLIKPWAAEVNSCKFSIRSLPFGSISYMFFNPLFSTVKSTKAGSGISSLATRKVSIISLKAANSAAAAPRMYCIDSNNEIPLVVAKSTRFSIDLAPIPRAGTLTTLKNAESSEGFSAKRMYAMAFLISARSKNRNPP